jgi:hypothetical protein
MSSSRIIYTPRSDASAEGEVAVLASVYRFILFDCGSARKEATSPGGPDDGTKIKEDSANESIIPK